MDGSTWHKGTSSLDLMAGPKDINPRPVRYIMGPPHKGGEVKDAFTSAQKAFKVDVSLRLLDDASVPAKTTEQPSA